MADLTDDEREALTERQAALVEHIAQHEQGRVLSALTNEERDNLRDWWDEETTVGVESAFPIIARIVADRERAARAEALREAGLAALSDGEGVPFDHDYDRAVVGAWLDERAEREEARQ